jgi:hypothetical protein
MVSFAHIFPQDTKVSYELYRELAGELCAPIDDVNMGLELRHELYLSKLVYLQNLQVQCFKNINSSQQKDCLYDVSDLENIYHAIQVTEEFLKDTIRNIFCESLKSAEKKACYASKHKHSG